jgi:hypothetical protein
LQLDPQAALVVSLLTASSWKAAAASPVAWELRVADWLRAQALALLVVPSKRAALAS